MASFDPSDREHAVWLLKAKFGDSYGDYEGIATAFINTELRDPFEKYRNDSRVEAADKAIAVLLEALKKLPREMRTEKAREVDLQLPDLVQQLGRWRIQLKVHENDPDPAKLASVLAAQNLRVRFAYEVAYERMFDRVPTPHDPEGKWQPTRGTKTMTGRDLALFGIALGLEKYGKHDDCDRIVDAWKKALRRAQEIYAEFQGGVRRRRRAARPF